ncbi:MAG: hypothetical protein ACOZDY_20420 [Pseudomonadota bacterium]
MSIWHLRIKGTPWCCCDAPDTRQEQELRNAMIKTCCSHENMSSALGLKVALAEIGYAQWEEIDIVRECCELRKPPEPEASE